jgi:hypothetical protein
VVADQPGTVFVSEDIDADNAYLLTGRFSAHWEAWEGPEHRDGPEGVPVEEALAWGRGHAELVLVLLGDADDHYSAGTQQPPPVEGDDADFPVWPEGKRVGRRRQPGMEHLDLVSEEPIAWAVRFPRRMSARQAERDAERLRAAVAPDMDVSELRCQVERGRDKADAVLRFIVFARSHDEAMKVVLDIDDRSMGQIPYPVQELGGDGQGWVMDDTGWDPMDDIRPLPTRRGTPQSS